MNSKNNNLISYKEKTININEINNLNNNIKNINNLPLIDLYDIHCVIVNIKIIMATL